MAARTCSVTGEKIYVGHVYLDGEMYFADESMVVAQLRADFPDVTKSMTDNEVSEWGYQADLQYYTEWVDEEDEDEE